ncbi:MAG: hypothetical protein P4M07_01405 [Xanthobacteraceae bacterium]|nr:hypothetical protein [Xanthobacteraceae bacterium]
MRPSDLTSELHALKRDLARAAHAANDRVAEAARSGVEDISGQIRTVLADLGDALGEEQKTIEALISERPMAALASAFALGIAVGVLLRRRS